MLDVNSLNSKPNDFSTHLFDASVFDRGKLFSGDYC